MEEEDDPKMKAFRDLGVSKSIIANFENIRPTKNVVQPSDYPSYYIESPNNPLENRHSTSEYSLMLNTAAMKYLEDDPAAMATIIRNSPMSSSRPRPNFEPGNVTLYGLPEDNVSLATRDFLTKNQLMK